MGFSLNSYIDGVEVSVRFPWEVGTVSFMAYWKEMIEENKKVDVLKKLLSDMFFDVIEVPRLSREEWKKIEDLASDKIIARALQPDILIGKLNLNSSDEMERRKAIKTILEEIDLATSLGMQIMALCSGPDPGEEGREEAKRLLVESLTEIAEEANSRGAFILLETFDREWDKKLLIGPLREGVEVVRRVQREYGNIALLWDLSHAPLLGEKPEDLLSVMEYVGHIHIGCGERVDKAWRDTHPGFFRENAANDVEDVARLLTVLLRGGYQGAVSFEVKPSEGEKTEEVLAVAKGVLISAFDRIVAEIVGEEE